MVKEDEWEKKRVAAATVLNRDELHDLTVAVTRVKSTAKATFDEPVDVAM